MKDKKKQLFSREDKGIFPIASEKGSIVSRQACLDGLLAHREVMGKMANEQLKDLWPASYTAGKSHGYRQRSLMSAKDAGSSLTKAFKSDK